MTPTAPRVRPLTRPRIWLLAATAILVVVVLAVSEAIEQFLLLGHSVDVGLLQLRLTYNHGVGFSLGADLPTWTVIAITGCVTFIVGIYAWLKVPVSGLATRAALIAILSGALANLFDRMVDGHVTDYLHTGWFPTFNLADTFVSVGAALFVITTALEPETDDPGDPPAMSSAAAGDTAMEPPHGPTTETPAHPDGWQTGHQ